MSSGGRVEKMQKNIAWGTFSRIVVMIYSFVSRTFFIQYLGVSNNGINGLFTNILTVLSFAELGIGTAMNFSLYKLVADNDIPKIKAYMAFYKKAYRIIAGVIAVIGLVIMPFIPMMLTPEEITNAGGNIYIIYGLYLFNTVTSYFVSYKYSLSNAEQKNYIFTNINLVFNLICQTGQLIMLIVTKNFICYCCVGAVVQLLQNLTTNWYMNKLYPFLKEKDAEKLSKEELAPIIKNVKALIITKIGSICINQTDNIIISMVINVTTVGMIDNYNTLLNNVNGFVNVVMNSQTASFGNLIASEGKEKQYRMFKNFRFLIFWMFGFVAIACFTLMTPFIVIWLGVDKTTATITIFLILINYYMNGHRNCIYNVKVAGGIFEQDKWLSFACAIVNLVTSVLFAKICGLPGVYIGTLLTGLLQTLVRPRIVYRDLFGVESWKYYRDGIKYLFTVLAVGAVCYGMQQLLLPAHVLATVSGASMLTRAKMIGGRFLILGVFAAVVPNVVFYLLYHKKEEFIYLKTIMGRVFKKITGKFLGKSAE